MALIDELVYTRKMDGFKYTTNVILMFLTLFVLTVTSFHYFNNINTSIIIMFLILFEMGFLFSRNQYHFIGLFVVLAGATALIMMILLFNMLTLLALLLVIATGLYNFYDRIYEDRILEKRMHRRKIIERTGQPKKSASTQSANTPISTAVIASKSSTKRTSNEGTPKDKDDKDAKFAMWPILVEHPEYIDLSGRSYYQEKTLTNKEREEARKSVVKKTDVKPTVNAIKVGKTNLSVKKMPDKLIVHRITRMAHDPECPMASKITSNNMMIVKTGPRWPKSLRKHSCLEPSNTKKNASKKTSKSKTSTKTSTTKKR